MAPKYGSANTLDRRVIIVPLHWPTFIKNIKSLTLGYRFGSPEQDIEATLFALFCFCVNCVFPMAGACSLVGNKIT